MENINVAFNKFWDRKVAELKWISLTIYCRRTSNYIAWCCNLWPLGDLLTKKFSRHSKSSTRKFSRINNFTKPTIDFQQKNKRCVNNTTREKSSKSKPFSRQFFKISNFMWVFFQPIQPIQIVVSRLPKDSWTFIGNVFEIWFLLSQFISQCKCQPNRTKQSQSQIAQYCWHSESPQQKHTLAISF